MGGTSVFLKRNSIASKWRTVPLQRFQWNFVYCRVILYLISYLSFIVGCSSANNEKKKKKISLKNCRERWLYKVRLLTVGKMESRNEAHKLLNQIWFFCATCIHFLSFALIKFVEVICPNKRSDCVEWNDRGRCCIRYIGMHCWNSRLAMSLVKL